MRIFRGGEFGFRSLIFRPLRPITFSLVGDGAAGGGQERPKGNFTDDEIEKLRRLRRGERQPSAQGSEGSEVVHQRPQSLADYIALGYSPDVAFRMWQNDQAKKARNDAIDAARNKLNSDVDRIGHMMGEEAAPDSNLTKEQIKDLLARRREGLE